jgi:hypothetical protein
MSFLDTTSQNLKQWIFGKQNERMEFIMDSYFKLSPEQRSGTLIGMGVFGILVLFGLIIIYISMLSSLQQQLDKAYFRASQLRDISLEFMATKQKFNDLQQKLNTANQAGSILTFLEGKTREMGIQGVFPSQIPMTEFPPSHPLSKGYSQAKLDYKASNLSLKKIIELVIAVENSPQMYKVSSLNIKGTYQNKVFFDAALEIEGLALKNK